MPQDGSGSEVIRRFRVDEADVFFVGLFFQGRGIFSSMVIKEFFRSAFRKNRGCLLYD